MASRLFDGLVLPASADFHVHLREGAMLEAVAPTIRQGGVETVFVMPNLVPPITTVEHALAYKAAIAKYTDVTCLMSLYLHPSITPDTIRQAKKAGLLGIKSYPAGVTTNSASGVVDYEQFYPVFKAMEEEDLVLNLHGEAPPGQDITVLNAEEAFLPTLLDLHDRFPRLRIVLEHCTTAIAVEAVKKCGPNVVGTITAHHLFLIVDDWAGDPINFCKPVAKLPRDRVALLKAATSGSPKFFLGTDSAPHPWRAKKGGMGVYETGKCAAGVFTQPYATQLVLEAFEDAVIKGAIDKSEVAKVVLEGFLGEFGRTFYRVEASGAKIKISAKEEKVMSELAVGGGGADSSTKEVVVPFRRNCPIYSLEWLSDK
ncbi:dihydroorotase, homodimeric type [Rhinocladiella mackenziei CBS 650.93]|uniref:dihydroorotase n=1 Tax=Rhinocladiella mackenziei CBS 650.93 TaxID=1442369 RepID=A0A0D2I4G5_9EURO|nr:dihydroorotase, homodimeric type [Rhinocladiella mackenziei CBS 650.93]KIX00679.1 dihydroorotase, homodimeric type [Rhinocladiella mackenziei CBS 650.93]